MSGDLVAMCGTVPAISNELLAKVREVEAKMLAMPQAQIVTEHLFHAGMYARTVRLAPGMVIDGAMLSRATILVIHGQGAMLINEGWAELDGYYIVPASAGRKQIFVARGAVEITLIYPTTVTTVAEAEQELTDEASALLSRRQQDNNQVTITGE